MIFRFSHKLKTLLFITLWMWTSPWVQCCIPSSLQKLQDALSKIFNRKSVIQNWLIDVSSICSGQGFLLSRSISRFIYASKNITNKSSRKTISFLRTSHDVLKGDKLICFFKHFYEWYILHENLESYTPWLPHFGDDVYNWQTLEIKALNNDSIVVSFLAVWSCLG